MFSKRFAENLMNEERILQWAEYELKTNKEVIEDVSSQQVRRLIEENDYVMVFLCKTRNKTIALYNHPIYRVTKLVIDKVIMEIFSNFPILSRLPNCSDI